jgi:aconitase A
MGPTREMPLSPAKTTDGDRAARTLRLRHIYLGLQVVMAKSFARVHWQNLLNFGRSPSRMPAITTGSSRGT